MLAYCRRQFILRRLPHITLRRIPESTAHCQSLSYTPVSDPKRVHSFGARRAKLAVRYAFPSLPFQFTPLPSRPR